MMNSRIGPFQTDSAAGLPPEAGRAVLAVCTALARACGQQHLDWEFTVRRRPAARGRIQGCWLVIWLLDQPRHRPDLPTFSDLLLAAQTAASPRAAQVSPGVRLEPIRVSRGWNGVLSVSLGIWWPRPLP